MKINTTAETLGLYTDFYELMMAQGISSPGKRMNKPSSTIFSEPIPSKGVFWFLPVLPISWMPYLRSVIRTKTSATLNSKAFGLNFLTI